MSFLSAYLLFILKIVTGIVLIGLGIGAIIALTSRKKDDEDDELSLTFLNKRYADDKHTLEADILSKKDRKKYAKKPLEPKANRPRLFVIDFNGSIDANEVSTLRRQVSAIIQTANTNDETLVRLESPGGEVTGYGLAASQLARLKDADIPLTVAVDKVAASGGYMMASVSNKILTAPFAVLGSVGVVAMLPNIHRLLKDNKVDIELHTAGEYKRTLTTMGENTEEGRAKFKEMLETTHQLFKKHVNHFRPSVDVDAISTGEIWYGQQALDNHLADAITTSDDYILANMPNKDVWLIEVKAKEKFLDQIKKQLLSLKSDATKQVTENKQYFL